LANSPDKCLGFYICDDFADTFISLDLLLANIPKRLQGRSLKRFTTQDWDTKDSAMWSLHLLNVARAFWDREDDPVRDIIERATTSGCGIFVAGFYLNSEEVEKALHD